MILKIRHDYVTNSSSSSFIISRDDVNRDRLVEILLEIASIENERRWGDPPFTFDDVEGDCVAYRYNIQEATPESPYEMDYYLNEPEIFNNAFIVDNDDNIRYDWSVIKEVLAKYNIPWRYGYCN